MNMILLTDAEEARVQEQITADPDASEATDAQLKDTKPFAEALPGLANTMCKNVGGRPRCKGPKVPVSIRLDRELVDNLKATGPGRQSRIDDILRRETLG